MAGIRILPILFNTDMVRAILEGRKTVTRRVIKPQPVTEKAGPCKSPYGNSFHDGFELYKPPFQPGDVLYVRETWAKQQGLYWHKAGLVVDKNGRDEHGTVVPQKWYPSIHMPREAARIFLRVTGVRVERLQDITVDGICAEGCPIPFLGWYNKPKYLAMITDWFRKIWDDGAIKQTDRDKYGWAANPWVWVIEFERCEKPDEFGH